ncbi:unnamed protein product [Haemonchus placei]|uniref:Reverse transcriptase domain-containing protein n=1 Tax=Haemonchus placei TaxID=6290 RepID=A0A0N4W7M8_HAEPC|nr:unnamed protein product [Haemonchus placei]
MLLNKLSSASLHEECVMESFDVTPLYTNVSNEAALEAIYELLCEHEPDLHPHGFTVTQVMTTLAECLGCSVFRWSGEYYKLRGLAMGQRLAPVLAIALMSKIEKQFWVVAQSYNIVTLTTALSYVRLRKNWTFVTMS